MKIAILTSALDIGVGGGVANIVIELQKRFQQKIFPPPTIYTYKKFSNPVTDDESINLNVKLFDHIDPFKYGYSPSLLNDLLNSEYDLIHINGMWEYFSIVSYNWWKKFRRPYVISTHGMLEPWAFGNAKYKKKILYHIIDKKYLSNSSAIVVSSPRETKNLRSLGIDTPTIYIPNGVSISDKIFGYPDEWLNLFGERKKILLFIGRFHPKKGIEEIIRALCEIKRSESNLLEEWRFMVYGWGRRNYSNYIKLIVKKNNLDKIVFINKPVFGDNKLQILQHANAFILPSKSEGFPIAVLEAWASKLPTLISKECNLGFAYKEGSALPIGITVEEITKDLKSFFKLNENYVKAIGIKGLNMVKSDFNWDSISDKYIELYTRFESKNL